MKTPAIFDLNGPGAFRGHPAGERQGIQKEQAKQHIMKATEYQGLKTGLDKLTEWSDTLRAVYAKVETPIPVDQRKPGGPTTRWTTTDEARKHAWFHNRHDLLTANQNWIAEVAGMMDSYLDGFVEENQGRADQGRAVTDDGRALFDAMSRFLDATDTPIEGMAGLYQDVRTRCRDWRDRMITWFPDLNHDPVGKLTERETNGPTDIPGNPSFVNRLIRSDAYKNAIKDGDITPPTTWNGTIKGLAVWLDVNELLARPKLDNVSEKTTRWKLANNVFLIDGKPVTAKQLKDGINH